MDFSLEQLDEKLDPLKFCRVNRKFIIDVDGLSDIIAYTNSRLQVKLNHFSEQEIIVSRERVKDFRKWLE